MTAGEENRAIARRLRAVRAASGLSLTAAARRCGLRTPTLASYERADRGMSAARLVEIAAGYGIHPVILVSDEDPAAVTRDGLESLARDLSEAAERLLKAVTAMPSPGSDGEGSCDDQH